jgi:hypothetical protein
MAGKVGQEFQAALEIEYAERVMSRLEFMNGEEKLLCAEKVTQ